MNKLQAALSRKNIGAPPVWMMRQAGRYHSHYQQIRKQHSFLKVCKTPEIAAEVAMGPIRDFDFDAAILFSDILFPLEAMGVPLDFNPGPQLGFHLRGVSDLDRYQTNINLDFFSFQADALRQTRALLPADKGLIAFVGAPLTLYIFAVEGSHKQGISSALAGLHDMRFQSFMEKLLPVLLHNMCVQAEAQPDCLAIFDSCAGDISIHDFQTLYWPYLEKLLTAFVHRYPQIPLIYYGQKLQQGCWQLFKEIPVACIGVDHHHYAMSDVLTQWHADFALQGNFDPAFLVLPPEQAQFHMRTWLETMASLPAEVKQGWICGLGHGVTPQAREENVRAFVRLSREILA